jgi:dolichol-phosphate mannosyltransferase
MKERLGIIVPVYNEGENISATLTAVEEQVKTAHKIYIVFDFDDDNTLPVAVKLREAGLPIEFVRNLDAGVANAIKTGLRSVNADFLLVTMADLSDDYSVVDKMCDLVSQGYDIVCGSRYMRGGKQIGGPFFKKLLSRTAGLTLKYLTGMPVHDVTNSFKLYRKTMVDNIEIQSESGFEIGMEIVVKAYFSGYKITELPCTWTDRQAGRSRFRLFKWLPKYLRWYFFALKKTLRKTFWPC